MSVTDDVSGADGGALLSNERDQSQNARSFVRTPFSVRRNVVKIWRPLPTGIWFELDTQSDHDLSIRRERRAAIGVVILILFLVAGLGCVGYRAGDAARSFPLIGKSLADVPGSLTALTGWYYAPGQSPILVLWTVAPSLLSWVIVRGLWIPHVVRGHERRDAAITFARHLLSVYLFVYMMVVVGASLMPILLLISPRGTETLRWCLWCFLFGESFFVPAVMWTRFIVTDRTGSIFGRYRRAGLALYLLLFVVIPILGMVKQLG